MICPFCKAEGQKSTLRPSGTTSATCMSTTMGYFDEDGAWVEGHDPNWYTQEYFCSRGHHFSVTRKQGQADDVKLVATVTGATTTVSLP